MTREKVCDELEIMIRENKGLSTDAVKLVENLILDFKKLNYYDRIVMLHLLNNNIKKVQNEK